MKFAREAWPFVLPFVALAILAVFLGAPIWAVGAALLALAILLFFRDPKRPVVEDADAVLAAADGKVLRVETVEAPDVGPGTFHKVVTFLSVFDVHVQKTPVAGKVLSCRYIPGAKVAAYQQDAGEVNERHFAVFERAQDGSPIGVCQIAGLVARRVVFNLEADQVVERADPLGLIKFGSRVDVYVPETYEILVKAGDRTKNGYTILARPPRIAA